MSSNVARPAEAAFVIVPDANDPIDGAIVTLSVAVAHLLPNWSCISTTNAVHVAPAVTGLDGWVFHPSLFGASGLTVTLFEAGVDVIPAAEPVTVMLLATV